MHKTIQTLELVLQMLNELLYQNDDTLPVTNKRPRKSAHSQENNACVKSNINTTPAAAMGRNPEASTLHDVDTSDMELAGRSSSAGSPKPREQSAPTTGTVQKHAQHQSVTPVKGPCGKDEWTPNRVARDHAYVKQTQSKEKRRKVAKSLLPTTTEIVDTPQYQVEHVTQASITSEENEEHHVSMETSSLFDEFSGISDVDYLEDDDYECETEPDTETDIDETITNTDSFLSQDKYIIFETKLDELMKFCSKCGQPVVQKAKSIEGSCVKYKISCHGGCEFTWKSQPYISSHQPCGNLLISSAILTTGNNFNNIHNFAKAMNLCLLSPSTHKKIQAATIFPVVQEQWNIERQKVVEDLRVRENFVLAGDARMDSPGHCGTHGSYTLMDTDGNGCEGTRKIVATELIHVSEVKNSNHLEPEGLRRCINTVMNEDALQIPVLTTDRHVMVGSIMKKDYPQIKHQFDLWHLVKSIIKKLWAKAKLKDCSDLGTWVQSISNHLWWVASSCGGDEQKLREMWLSILQHVTNKHKWTGNKVFHHCAHESLSRQEQKKKKWLKPKSAAFKALQDVVTNKLFLRDLARVTMFCHTGQIEVYHSMLLQYAPKRIYFPYDAMKARLLVAALDWNGQERDLVTDKDGNPVQDTVYQKRTKKWVLRNKYSIKKTHVKKLMLRILQVKEQGIELPPISAPANLTTVATVPKPEKSTLVKVSRMIPAK